MSTQDRGFGSMPKGKVQEIASKGGHTSHSEDHNNKKNHSTKDDHNSDSKDHSNTKKGNDKNFADKDKEEVKELASEGGKASHK